MEGNAKTEHGSFEKTVLSSKIWLRALNVLPQNAGGRCRLLNIACHQPPHTK